MERRTAIAVALGGFAGALCRHAIAVALPDAFPWGTLAVNVGGAFLLGGFVYGTAEHGRVSDVTRLFVSTGFLSSFTTYSTFASETVALDPPLAAVNVAVNYGLGLLAVLLAREVVRWRS
ncbi:MAG: CrcB protein [Natronomonas sp.]|jgi:CrcB protein|uniref:fluoride efflux transporter FluC n=1 Tax=Natronomonas sp. TaxID=2184060 RepID=UPI003989ED30